MKLIDADALIADLDKGLWGKDWDKVLAEAIIRDAPTIDVVPKDFHDKTCEAMAKRHTEEIQKLMPKRGEWIQKEHKVYLPRDCEPYASDYNLHYDSTDHSIIDKYWHCSECDYEASRNSKPTHINFCPNCGADMRERECEL